MSASTPFALLANSTALPWSEGMLAFVLDSRLASGTPEFKFQGTVANKTRVAGLKRVAISGVVY